MKKRLVFVALSSLSVASAAWAQEPKPDTPRYPGPPIKAGEPVQPIPGPRAYSAAEGMKPGLWEIKSSVTMEMPGMPKQPQAHVIKHCYTKEQLDDQVKGESVNEPMPTGCKNNSSFSGGVSRIDINCPDMQMTGGGNMKSDSEFTVEMHSLMKDPEMQGAKMHSVVSGKRLGDCAKP